MNKKRILVFGTGNGAANAAPLLAQTYDIVGFLDNDTRAQRRRFQRKAVYAPERLSELDWDEVHIASATYFREMQLQLGALGVRDEQIHVVPLHVLVAEQQGCTVFCVAYYAAWVVALAALSWGVAHLFG